MNHQKNAKEDEKEVEGMLDDIQETCKNIRNNQSSTSNTGVQPANIRIRSATSRSKKNRPEIATALQTLDQKQMLKPMNPTKMINKKKIKFTKKESGQSYLSVEQSEGFFRQGTTKDTASIEKIKKEIREKQNIVQPNINQKKIRKPVPHLKTGLQSTLKDQGSKSPNILKNKVSIPRKMHKSGRSGANSVRRNKNTTLEVDSLVLPEIPANRKTPMKKLDKTFELNRSRVKSLEQSPISTKPSRNNRKHNQLKEALKFEKLKLVAGEANSKSRYTKRSSNMRLYGKDMLCERKRKNHNQL
ncbi:unnamed protein product [Moneuplotes crassus]|uniref:Uncharacterized protein n=1 Tax=Euplotes crassus TaxID=5936 RepID=A0AAD1Y4V7_EUPCR|nr:unnamed protein product [Moneuplotes crassus]